MKMPDYLRIKIVPSTSEIIVEAVKEDLAPVVRCKDCKFNTSKNKCLNPNSIIAIPNDDDYCSYGERKED